jgi:hypothetical protein
MSSLFKSTMLSFGLLAGAAVVAQAQSVSSLPPSSPAIAPTAAAPTSSAKILPNPGGGSSWEEEHYQAKPSYDADASQHPYSTSIGPKPGSHSSGGKRITKRRMWTTTPYAILIQPTWGPVLSKVDRTPRRARQDLSSV